MALFGVAGVFTFFHLMWAGKNEDTCTERITQIYHTYHICHII